MFDNGMFENWLDKKASEIVEKMGDGEQLRTEEMMVLVLKAQSNHFYHLDKELNDEMKALRIDMDRRFEQFDKRLEQVDKRLEQVDKRFEENRQDMDKRFTESRQDMDKRFTENRQETDKRFDQLMRRMDRFMFWSLGMTVASAIFVVNYLK